MQNAHNGKNLFDNNPALNYLITRECELLQGGNSREVTLAAPSHEGYAQIAKSSVCLVQPDGSVELLYQGLVKNRSGCPGRLPSVLHG